MLNFGVIGDIYNLIMTAIRGCGPGVDAADSIFAAPESAPLIGASCYVEIYSSITYIF